nr:ATP-binding protein [Hydrogenophilus thiooxidans]
MRIEAQAELAHQHVRHYLALARAEASRAALGKRANLAEVLAKTLAAFETIFAERALRWERCWPAICWVVGDARDLIELLGNLLENAARHATSAVAVEVTPETCAGEAGWRLRIDDDGPGFAATASGAVPADEANRDASSPELLPRAGLGMTVSRTIVSALGGTIVWTHSERLGGCCVSVWLPERFQTRSPQ